MVEGVDGRRARRERGRIAVVDAAFELLQAGRIPPPVDEVAERAGVSVATVFRYFDGLADLQLQALARFRERFEPLLTIPRLGEGDRRSRIDRFVTARLSLYRDAGTIMELGRLRSLETASLAAAGAEVRTLLRDQTAHHFATELDSVTPARRDDVVTVVCTLTSVESWWSLRRDHHRTDRQIRRAWRDALDALLPRDHREGSP